MQSLIHHQLGCAKNRAKTRADKSRTERFFSIIDKIRSVAYKLKLPDSSSIHLVFHVSQLKLAVPKRVVKVSTDVRIQALIQWSGMPSTMATWEDMETLRQRFPRAPAWGKQVLKRWECYADYC